MFLFSLGFLCSQLAWEGLEGQRRNLWDLLQALSQCLSVGNLEGRSCSLTWVFLHQSTHSCPGAFT